MFGTTRNAKRRAHLTYIWTIRNTPRNYTSFISPEFTVQSIEMTKWYLAMHNLGDGELYFSINRAKEDNGPESIEVECELSFLDIKGSSLIKRSATNYFRKGKRSQVMKFLRIDTIFIERRAEFCPKDILTVRCRIWRKRTEISKSELCFGSTNFNVHQSFCVWAIKGFSSLQLGEERIRILNSTTNSCPQLTLILTLAENNGKEYVVIHLVPSHLTENFKIESEIALLDGEGVVVIFNRASTYISRLEQTLELCTFEKCKLISDAAAFGFDDVLLLRCELKLISGSVESKIEDYKLMDYSDSQMVQTEKSETYFDELNETAVCPFKEIVNEFKKDGTLGDVCLRAGTKSFPVHKLILSSRSPVFKAMFTKDMREKASKCIDVPDLDADTLGHLLFYIYEDKIQELTWETAANLFEAADKYELLTLKEKCSNYLKSNLCESNICEILVLADLHHDKCLLKSVQEFILNNSEILYSDTWKDFKRNHSKLALETAEQIIYNMKPSRS